MSNLTRQQIQTQIQQQIQENIDTDAFDQTSQINVQIDLVCDTIAQRTDSFYLPFQAAVVNGQTSYCPPGALYKVMAATITDQNGNVQPPLQIIADYNMDKVYSGWRQMNQFGTPSYMVMYGASSFSLYPVPNYSVANGLTIYGWAVPGSAGTGGASYWPNPTSTCPISLPNASWAVVWGVAVNRWWTFAGRKNYPQALIVARAEILQNNYDDAVARIEVAAARYSAAQQFRDASMGTNQGGGRMFGWWG